MSWAEDTKWRLKFAAIGLAFLCPAFFIWMATKTKQQLESYNWPSVEGKVLSTRAKEWFDKDSKTEKFFGRVVYQYSVAGTEYETDLTNFGPGTKRTSEYEALMDVSQYHPDQRVTVYYDPENPNTGVIGKGIPPIHQAMFVGLAILTLVTWTASGYIVRGWLVNRSRKRKVEGVN